MHLLERLCARLFYDRVEKLTKYLSLPLNCLVNFGLLNNMLATTIGLLTHSSEIVLLVLRHHQRHMELTYRNYLV